MVLSLAGAIGVVAYLAAWFVSVDPSDPRAPALRQISNRQTVAFGCLVLGSVLLLRAAGLWLGDAVGVPVLIVAAGAAVVYAGAGPELRARWTFGRGAPPIGRPSFAHLLLGGMLVVGGVVWFLTTNRTFDGVLTVLLAVAVTTLGLAIVFGPWVYRLVNQLTEERRDRIRSEERAELAAHLHAPLQSGSNAILKRMGRHWYTAESYRARIEWLAERLPVFGLGADVMAGFPGETNADLHLRVHRLVGPHRPEDPRVGDMLDGVVAEDDLQLDDLTELLLRGQGSEMEMAIRAGGQHAGLERLMYFLQVGFFSRRIADQFDWSTIERDLERLLQALEARGLDPGQLARIRNYLELRLEAFKRMIRQHVERELERRAYRQGEKLSREVLSEKPLFALTADEVAQMKAVVARLARKIKDALALRQRQEQRGRLDTRRTIRKSLQYGGVPMEVFLKRRHRDRPKLVTVCDVSDSVRNASRFMLQLVWSLQECFSRVRSFVFVSEIAEVTQAFDTYPVERAIEWALKGAPVDYHCRSDFGYAFSRFTNTELDSLDRKTTVIVLGDARNNYNDPQAWALRLIRERVKGIIWLNPEGQWGWGIGDSVMPMYAPSCDMVRECRTIAQIGEVVDMRLSSDRKQALVKIRLHDDAAGIAVTLPANTNTHAAAATSRLFIRRMIDPLDNTRWRHVERSDPLAAPAGKRIHDTPEGVGQLRVFRYALMIVMGGSSVCVPERTADAWIAFTTSKKAEV